MTQQIIKDARQSMEKHIQGLKTSLATIRAGRANASVLDQVTVEYYGVDTPVNQVASISVPEARMLLITPYDPNSLKDIEKAILKSNIGINPNNDGSVLRLVFPALTEERRKELAKEVGKYEEECKIRLRHVRRDAIDQAAKAEKAKEMTEDELHVMEKDIQSLTDEFVKKVENIASEKEKDLMND
ncbi:ribosome recycling factor [Atopobacter sp. AH10]|uniref:ribosome recycling factor n=1 Tax=Atopobacter sp. AH10 TaxID=2315861 RepID=UPI000EF28D23|nr:ribosome recycling factor [Atopobacter sp. AH10]RLK62452.1 ribosome recycling factor [Atopobacter sp. AH10]